MSLPAETKPIRLILPACLATVLLALPGLARAQAPAAPAPATPFGWPLVIQDDFSASEFGPWKFSAREAWKLLDQDGNRVASQFKHIVTETPVRSPFNRAIRTDVTLGSFVLDVKLQSTARDYPHRSLCLFFGFQDPAHMYYVHFGQKTDDHANQIFLVNNEPRKKISVKTTPGTPWDNAWHRARILRNVETGSIEVFFDDLQTPVMTAQDKTFLWGQVGIGSFDDTGNFDDFTVHGLKVEPPPSATKPE